MTRAPELCWPGRLIRWSDPRRWPLHGAAPVALNRFAASPPWSRHGAPRLRCTASPRGPRAGAIRLPAQLPREPGAWAGPLGSDVRLPILTPHIVL